MDKKAKKVVRKKGHTHKKTGEIELTDRIRDAVNVLKRYESPEILREVNQISTPVSCPAYPIMKRYGKMKLFGAEATAEEKPIQKLSPHMMGKSSSHVNLACPMTSSGSKKIPRQSQKFVSLYRPKEISLANYLKTNVKNAAVSKNTAPKKNQVPNQSSSRKQNIRSSQKTQRNPKTQDITKNRRMPSQVDRNKFLNPQMETTIGYSTVIPVKEAIKQKQYLPNQTYILDNQDKVHCPRCLQSLNSKAAHGFNEKGIRKNNDSMKNRYNTLPYSVDQANITLHRNAEGADKRKQQIVKRKSKKKKKVTAKPERGKPPESIARVIPQRQTPRNITWSHGDIKAFRMGVGRSETKTQESVQDPPPSRLSQSESKTPMIMPIENPATAGEVSYRMCKQCPLRQLISKIDPVVGKDKKSYPVVAFTCCRKPPTVKSTSTSM